MEHVRLMEIGSEVFAQEVEPTGLLSMEMTLARYIIKFYFCPLILLCIGGTMYICYYVCFFSRYRHAAVHGKGLSPSEKLSRPRSGCTDAFIGSALLAERGDFQMQINEW